MLEDAWPRAEIGCDLDDVVRVAPDGGHGGDELVLESSLANPRPLPLPWIEVWEQLPFNLGPEGAGERSFLEPERVWVSRGLALWPYQRLRWRRRLACRRRGVFRLGAVRLRSGDPFGFFERERALDDDVDLLVYPRVVPLRRLALYYQEANVLLRDRYGIDYTGAASQPRLALRFERVYFAYDLLDFFR